MSHQAKKLPISVFIITKNEEDRVGDAIKSVIDFVDEVLVVDSGSTDKTVELAKSLGARTMFHEWNGYGPQKVYAESLCKNKWVLNIDADERISKGLKKALTKLHKSGKIDEHTAYRCYYNNIFFHYKKPAPWIVKHKLVRFYNKEKHGFKDSIVHDSVDVVGGNIGLLKGQLYEISFRDYTHWINKINSYSSMQAIEAVNTGKKYCKCMLPFKTIFSFLKAYFIRGYILYGMNGYMYSLMYAFARTMKYAKTIDLANPKLKK